MATLHYAVVLYMWCTIMDAKRPPVAETAALAMVWESSPKSNSAPAQIQPLHYATSRTACNSASSCFNMVEKMHALLPHHALQFKHSVSCDFSAFSCASAFWATSFFTASEGLPPCPTELAFLTLSTSTVNLIASAAAFVRR